MKFSGVSAGFQRNDMQTSILVLTFFPTTEALALSGGGKHSAYAVLG
jgi:hypothetical protein